MTDWNITNIHAPRQLGLFQELIVDSFAGGGGASTGIEWALGKPVDIAINHDAEAIAMHSVNHPLTKHFCESVWDVNPKEATGGRPVGLAWFSPDCFPAGTQILTTTGYRAIEDLRVGDLVLTHKSRWRPVTEVSSTHKALKRISGHGHPGLLVSEEHPFYTRTKSRRWRNLIRSYESVYSEPEWTPVSSLSDKHLWATPTVFERLPVPEIPTFKNKRQIDISESLLWLAGRYLADGWTRLTETRAELVLTCGASKRDSLAENLQHWSAEGERSGSNEMKWHIRQVDTAFQFSTNCRGLVIWLREQFGHGAENKRVPGWVLGLDLSQRQALLSGYVSGDGWSNGEIVECSTISKALAFGIKALANSIGHTVTLYFCDVAGKQSICGREINQKNAWKIKWRPYAHPSHKQTYHDGEHEWSKIKKIEHLEKDSKVFNIGVEEDESYVADGIIVHNCKHFSRAKGGKPKNKNIRSLAWVAIRWAKQVKPRVIFLENVSEFVTWGPLGPDGEPCPVRKGSTFTAFVNAFRRLGYQVEYKELSACDFGAPTTRKRFFMIARCDGQPICWPEPTHGDPTSEAVKAGRLKAWRTAAEIIDWSLPCPSIFERKRPLVEATLRRIAHGIRKFVLENPKPFIVTCNHGGEGFRGQGLDKPFNTITAARDAHGVVSPTLIQTGYGERPGQSPRVPGLDKPLGTAMAQGIKHALAVAHLMKNYGGNYTGPGVSLDSPTHTITATDHHSLVATNLIRHFGTATGSKMDEPVRTVMADGAGGKTGLVAAFLDKYNGANKFGQAADRALDTVTATDGFSLVTVMIDGVEYVLTDIGMRMLKPHELFAAQGFPNSYNIAGNGIKPFTQETQVRMVGNSVSPCVARALVAANFAVAEKRRRA